MKVVSRAVDGCHDGWEEMALAFCAAITPQAKKLMRASELRGIIRGLIADAQAATVAINEAEMELEARIEEENGANAEPRLREQLFMALGALGVVVAIVFVVIAANVGPVFGVVSIIGVGGAIAGFVAGSNARGARLANIAAAEEARAAAEADLGRRRQALDGINAALEVARGELDAIQVTAVVHTVGRVALPVRSIMLAGYPAVLDESGLVDDYRFELPNFVYDSSALDALAQRIDRLRQPPVLLEPQETQEGEIDALHGEELELRTCVEDFAAFVGAIPTVVRNTPLVPRSCGAGNLPSMRALERDRSPVVTARSAGLDAQLEQIATISAEANDVRTRAAQARIELSEAYEGIRSLLGEYQTLRSSSMADLHSNLRSAMERSSWCRVRYYCPKAMQVPRYLYETTGIDIERVHEYSFDVLMDVLMRNDEVALRLSQDEELRNKLSDCKRSVEELEYAITTTTASMLPGEATSAMGSMNVRVGAATSAIASQLRSQLDQSVKHLRQVVTQAITGSARPLLEIATQSRLRFDPERGIWSSEVAGTEYADQHHADMGRLLRLHEDVLFPIWNHLWTEKADFRRSELFRTNEQLLRMKEKESEKLIEIGNQFRADMRSVREQLKTLVNDLNSKVDQIRSTRDGLAALGLLPEEDLARLSDAVLDDLVAGTGGALEHASAKETILSLEPTAQADRRGSAVDPIDVSRGPSLLFAESAPQALIRNLAARSAAAAPGQVIGLPDGGI